MTDKITMEELEALFGPHMPIAALEILHAAGKTTDQMREELHAMAGRMRAPNDDPATTVYGRLLHRHMKAARNDFDGAERAKLFQLIEDFREQFPDECQIWEDRYS